jgi:hypothetical protein
LVLVAGFSAAAACQQIGGLDGLTFSDGQGVGGTGGSDATAGGAGATVDAEAGLTEGGEPTDAQLDEETLERDTGLPDTGDASVHDALQDDRPIVDSPPDEPAGTGRVLEWLMEEGAGQVASDSSGHGYSLVLGTSGAAESEDPHWTTHSGRICGQASLEFDGVDDVATSGALPALDPLTAFTVTFCIYPVSAGGAGYGRVISREGPASFDDWLVNVASNRMGVEFVNTENTEFATDTEYGSLTMGTRSCWAVTYDDASADRKPRIYRDGVEVGYASRAGVEGTYKTSSNVLRVGNNAESTRAFEGVIDTVAIDDHVLTQPEIQARALLCSP